MGNEWSFRKRVLLFFLVTFELQRRMSHSIWINFSVNFLLLLFVGRSKVHSVSFRLCWTATAKVVVDDRARYWTGFGLNSIFRNSSSFSKIVKFFEIRRVFQNSSSFSKFVKFFEIRQVFRTFSSFFKAMQTKVTWSA